MSTGAPLPFGVQYSRAFKDDHMKALSANSFGVYAVGTSDPAGSPQLLLMAWRTDGSMRPPFYTFLPTPSRGNDVETRLAPPGCEIYVGGYDGTGGATWRFVHGTGFNSSVVKPALWKGASSGTNPKPYGPLAQVTDEVYDIGLGIGTYSGHVFSAGAAQLGAGTYGQNLQCIAPNGQQREPARARRRPRDRGRLPHLARRLGVHARYGVRPGELAELHRPLGVPQQPVPAVGRSVERPGRAARTEARSRHHGEAEPKRARRCCTSRTRRTGVREVA